MREMTIWNRQLDSRNSVNEWYRIEIVKELNTKLGVTKLLTLRDREMNRFTVWPTKLILDSIDKKWNERRDNGSLFIRSLGKKKSKSSPFSYYDFKYKLVN